MRRHPRLTPFKVRGPSMLPTLRPGDMVAAARLSGPPAPGSIVIVRLPGGDQAVKRVASVEGDERVVVVGDNLAQSTDSRDFGSLSFQDIVGVVRFVYWPPSRWRVL